MESSGERIVPSVGDITCLYVIKGPHLVPYQRPSQPPAIQTRLQKLRQNATELLPCPSRLPGEKSKLTVDWTEPHDSSLYSLPTPQNQAKHHTHVSGYHVPPPHTSTARQPAHRKFALDFPSNLDTSFHSGLLGSSVCSSPPNNTSIQVSDTSAAIVPEDELKLNDSHNTEESFSSSLYSMPTKRKPTDTTAAGNPLPILFYPRKKEERAGKRRKVAKI